MTPVSTNPWSSTPLSNNKLFEFESGVWTGKKPPFSSCCVLRNTNFNDDGTLDFTDVAEIEIEARLLERKTLLPGDIILERSGGGPTQPVGRVAYFDKQDRRYCFSNFTTRLRVCRPDVIDANFLHLYLHHVHLSGRTEKLQRRTTGIRNLDFGEYQKLPIPLPSLPVQRAVARILLTTKEAKEARQRELTLERERKDALMETLFTHGTRGESTKQTEIGEIPESWRIVEVDGIADVGNGSTPSRADERYWKGGTIPWITSTKVHAVVIREADEFVTESARSECHLPLVPQRSIVVAITGQGKTLGNAAILEFETCINQHLAYIHITDESLLPYFALYYFRSKYQYFRGVSSGGGSTKGALTCGFFKRMKIPVPSREEQSEVAALLSACETKCVSLEKEIVLLDEFFAAALDELMTGRLDVAPLVDGGSNA